MAFLCGAVKSGHLHKMRKGHSRQKSRYWVVLTDTFLHFFHAPQVLKLVLNGLPSIHTWHVQDSIPHKSICVDEYMATKDNSTHSVNFRLTYYRKDHVIVCSSPQEAEDWVSAIVDVKRKRAKVIGRIGDRQKTPLEQRIHNYMMGLKLSYKVCYGVRPVIPH